MTHREVFGEARWLSPRSNLDAALFRSEIEIKNDFQKAELTVCGLGWFIFFINGKRVRHIPIITNARTWILFILSMTSRPIGFM